MSLIWDNIDSKSVDTARVLAADAVEKVGNGHPGTAVSLAPVAYLLFQKVMTHDPADEKWTGRDRFILSVGHSSLTIYNQLYLAGYGLELDDIKSLRTWGSATPGHPEYGHTVGVETTTGPLGQGVANAVGMAMASRYVKGLFDPESKTKLFDHNIWVLASDGDLQEGVSAEASSLAGTQSLGNLKLIYDDNRISIEGDTHVAFTEDVSARYLAYGWMVIEVPTKSDGNVDREKLEAAMFKAAAEKSKPVLIRLHSIIAWPAPNAKGTAKSHGSALGNDEIESTKKLLGLDPAETFFAPKPTIEHARKVKERGRHKYELWLSDFDVWKGDNPERADLLSRLTTKQLPKDWDERIPQFPSDKDVATRAASGKAIQYIAEQLPEFWGGSADLAESNNTTIENGGSFLPVDSKIRGANPFGRVVHFGIREHAMAAILNGAALHGFVKPFGGTFLVFSDYMRGSVRLSALMQLPVTYVWTHDSIGLGEDGPTHQPVEHLAALRAIPGLAIIRPADANEVSASWIEIIKRGKPAGLALSRQNLPVIDRYKYQDISGVKKGAYVLAYGDDNQKDACQVILIATGSEVHLALSARENLAQAGIKARVVSAPCLEWFKEQPDAYQNQVLPKYIKARVSIEAGIAQPWYEFIGNAGVAVSLEHFGASASASVLFKEFGITVDTIVNAAKTSLDKVHE